LSMFFCGISSFFFSLINQVTPGNDFCSDEKKRGTQE